MKSVLISIQPKWVEKIVNGEKTIDVRKTKPKLEVPFKVYIYATNPQKWFRFGQFGRTSDELLWLADGKVEMCDGFKYWGDSIEDYKCISGKVIGEFVCNEIHDLSKDHLSPKGIKDTCLTENEIINYANGKTLYAWHISDLVIYDKPKGLNEFVSYCGNSHCYNCRHFLFDQDFYGNTHRYCGTHYRKEITRPPQSWCYCYVEEL